MVTSKCGFCTGIFTGITCSGRVNTARKLLPGSRGRFRAVLTAQRTAHTEDSARGESLQLTLLVPRAFV